MTSTYYRGMQGTYRVDGREIPLFKLLWALGDVGEREFFRLYPRHTVEQATKCHTDACCWKAEPVACVCRISYRCPDHTGGRTVCCGSHD